MKKIILTFLCCLFLCASAYAAPAVTYVGGTMLDGQTLTITSAGGATGFGATGPNIVLFTDFEETGNDGDTIATGTGSAKIGHWDAAGGGPASQSAYSSAYKNSGSLSWATDWYCPSCGSEDGPGNSRQLQDASFPSGATEIYVSMWEYAPTGFHLPGESHGNVNWKQIWIWDQAHSDIRCAPNYFAASDQWFHYYGFNNTTWYTGGGCSGDCSDCSGRFAFNDEAEYNPRWVRGQWSRWEFYFKLSINSDGRFALWDLNNTHSRAAIVDYTGRTAAQAGDAWDRVSFAAFARPEPNATGTHWSINYHDDVYVSTGAGARARVEIGNNATYTSCTNLAVCTVNTGGWGDTSITATMRAGSFGTSGTAYLFVTDANGVTSVGYEVTLGEGDGNGLVKSLGGGTFSGQLK